MAPFADEMLQQMCGIFGDPDAGCPILDQIAEKVNMMYIRIDTCFNM